MLELRVNCYINSGVWRKMTINLSTLPSGCHSQSPVLWNLVLPCNVHTYVKNQHLYGTYHRTIRKNLFFSIPCLVRWTIRSVVWIYEYFYKPLFNIRRYVMCKLLCKQILWPKCFHRLHSCSKTGVPKLTLCTAQFRINYFLAPPFFHLLKNDYNFKLN